MKNLTFLLFPTSVPATLMNSKLQIHNVSPTNPDILKFITEFLKSSKKFKIFPSFTRSLKCKKSHPKMLDVFEFIR